MITDSCSDSAVFGTILVSSGEPYCLMCELVRSNSYTASVGTRHCISVKLFDAYRNPAHYNDLGTVRQLSQATVDDHILTAHTGPDAVRLGLVSTKRSTQFVVFSFTPHKPARAAMLNVIINRTSLVACPIAFAIDPVKEGLESRLNRLRKYLRAEHCMGYTPTLTIKRDMLLESAVQVIQRHHFSRILRIRFGDEPGIDMGGIVR